MALRVLTASFARASTTRKGVAAELCSVCLKVALWRTRRVMRQMASARARVERTVGQCCFSRRSAGFAARIKARLCGAWDAMLCILMYTFYLGTEGGRAKGCGISTGNLGELVATSPNGREYDATIILYLRSISRPQCACANAAARIYI